MEEKKIKRFERFYFDTLNGVEAFMEVDWNDYACEEGLIRVKIRNEEMIIRQDELETLLLALTKDPSRYMRPKHKKVGIKSVPVPNSEYKKYRERKDKKEKYGKI